MTGRVRISDVASAAGASIATVSASLNEVESARISADTRAPVREVADRQGHVPNRLAQGLRAQRSGTIGFIGDRLATTPYAVGMVLGALEAARAADRVVLLMNTEGDRDLEARGFAALLRHQVDGVLYATMFHRSVEVPAVLRDTPVVLVDAESADPTVSSAVPDEVGGAMTAVGELLGQGHRRIGIINNADPSLASTGRLEGYNRALERAGILPDPRLVVAATDIGPEGGYPGGPAAAGPAGAAYRPVLLPGPDGDGGLPGGAGGRAGHPPGPVGRRVRRHAADRVRAVPRAHHGGAAPLPDGCLGRRAAGFVDGITERKGETGEAVRTADSSKIGRPAARVT
jgi:LacI family transcriptional regulator